MPDEYSVPASSVRRATILAQSSGRMGPVSATFVRKLEEAVDREIRQQHADVECAMIDHRQDVVCADYLRWVSPVDERLLVFELPRWRARPVDRLKIEWRRLCA